MGVCEVSCLWYAVFTRTHAHLPQIYILHRCCFFPNQRRGKQTTRVLYYSIGCCLCTHTDTHTHTRCTITTRCVWGGSCRCHWSAAGSLYEERWDGVMLESHCSIYGQAQFPGCPISDLWNHCYVHIFRIHTHWANFSSYRCATSYPLDQIAGYLLRIGCLEMSLRQTGMMEG